MQEEKYGTRDRSYSAWHRRNSTRRFIGIEGAQLLAMIDLDASLYVEYDDGTKEPIALIETAIDRGQKYKCALVTANLAKRANLPCFVVLYMLSKEENPADVNWKDIDSFRVKRLWPKKENQWRVMTPKQWAENLLKMREWSSNNLDLEYQQMKHK
jgi:hypothetical protein